MASAPILTTNEVAAQLGTDPKTLRKFFRSDKCKVIPVGQGKRYALTNADVKGLTKAFQAWHTAKAIKVDEPKPTNGKAPKKTTKKAKVVELEEDLELDDIEPTDDELEDLDLDDETDDDADDE